MEQKVPESTDLKDLSPFEKRILHDFYLSFRISEGRVAFQSYVLVYAARSYPPQELKNTDQLNNKLSPHIERLKPPEMHTQTINVGTGTDKIVPLTPDLAQTIQGGFKDQWEYNLKIFRQLAFNLKRPALNPPDDPETEIYYQTNWPNNVLLAEIINYMAKRDRNFQSKDRPMRTGGADPNESFLRSYMIEGKKTGSETYDRMFEEMKVVSNKLRLLEDKVSAQRFMDTAILLGINYQNASDLRTNIVDLITNWEKSHPGQKFYDRK